MNANVVHEYDSNYSLENAQCSTALKFLNADCKALSFRPPNDAESMMMTPALVSVHSMGIDPGRQSRLHLSEVNGAIDNSVTARKSNDV